MNAHIELANRAARDARSMDPQTVDVRVRRLTGLPVTNPALNVVALVGHHPWRRARVGDYRILFRPLTDGELAGLTVEANTGYLIARIMHRSELDRAVAGLSDP